MPQPQDQKTTSDTTLTSSRKRRSKRSAKPTLGEALVEGLTEAVNATQVVPSVDDVDPTVEPVNLAPIADPFMVAKTMNEVFSQMQAAKANGTNEVVVTEAILKHILQSTWTKEQKSMSFHNVMLYQEGYMDEVKKKNSRHMEEVLFGHSNAPIDSGAIIGSGQLVGKNG